MNIDKEQITYAVQKEIIESFNLIDRNVIKFSIMEKGYEGLNRDEKLSLLFHLPSSIFKYEKPSNELCLLALFLADNSIYFLRQKKTKNTWLVP